MLDIEGLKSFIRFQLHNLKAQNKHHEFESLSRHFARLRVCENILPSTGPVTSLGDQGRDFETYRTYLQSTPIALSTFIGMSNFGKRVVFACSLQTDIYKKIKKDIKSICTAGTKVDSICYFCEENLPVGKRHQLQQWAQEEYQTELEVFDGEALSEELASLDVFWIAERYLDVPSDMYPVFHECGEKYAQYKKAWIIDEGQPHNYAHFSQVKYALRRSTFNEAAKPDLLRWITKMEQFRIGAFPQDIKRKAIYEICVANLRGLNNLTECAPLIKDYFSTIKDLSSFSNIEDAVALLTYCSVALKLHHFFIDEVLLTQWTAEIIHLLESQLESPNGQAGTCKLLQLRGATEFIPHQPNFDIRKAFPWWEKMLDTAQVVTLFPLESFVDTLAEMVHFLGEDEEFIRITDRANELLAGRTNGYVLAEKSKNVALAYYENNNYLQCIRQLHKSRVGWHSAETLVGSLYAMLILADCYLHLGLAYASKFYFMCVFHLSSNNEGDEFKPFLPRSLFGLANSSYSAGEWYYFFGLLKSAFHLHNAFEEVPGDYRKDDNAYPAIAHCAISLMLMGRFGHEDVCATVKADIAEWPISMAFKDFILNPKNEDLNYWTNAERECLIQHANQQLTNRPFSDFGKIRRIQWNALGIHWIIDVNNDLRSVTIAEELAAICQIVIAEIPPIDLVLLPMNVHIEVFISKAEHIQIEHIHDNERLAYKVSVPELYSSNVDRSGEFRSEALSILLSVLHTCSTLPMERFNNAIEKLISEGLSNKAFWVRPYAEMCEFHIENSDYLKLNKTVYDPIFSEDEFYGWTHNQLAWIDTDGPGYSKSTAEMVIRERYEKAIMPVRLTLSKIVAHPRISDLILSYKKRGYQDWKILLIINNIALNYRVQKLMNGRFDPKLYQKLMIDIALKEEMSNDIPFEIEIFSKEAFEMYDKIISVMVAKTWKLEIKVPTPCLSAVDDLLKYRYYNDEDDVPHENFFGQMVNNKR